MGRRFALVLAGICAVAASACSVLTSWDDVSLGALADASARDADRRDTGSGIGDGGPILVDAGVDANCWPGATACACTPGTSVCVPNDTSTAGKALLYACTDAGTYSMPIECDEGCATIDNGGTAAATGCACTLNGTYCGGHDVAGSPNDLYECGPNGLTYKETCPFGQTCRTSALGNDDCLP